MPDVVFEIYRNAILVSNTNKCRISLTLRESREDTPSILTEGLNLEPKPFATEVLI
jgi:hypothetical protein